MNQDLKKELTIPLILTAIFVASSFIPVIQIVILTLDGGLIPLINKIVAADNTGSIWAANIIANLLPSILFLFLFFKAIKLSVKILTASFSMIFMTAFIFFLTDGIDSDPYFLNFILIALISGSILTFIAIFKYRQIKQKGALD